MTSASLIFTIRYTSIYMANRFVYSFRERVVCTKSRYSQLDILNTRRRKQAGAVLITYAVVAGKRALSPSGLSMGGKIKTFFTAKATTTARYAISRNRNVSIDKRNRYVKYYCCFLLFIFFLPIKNTLLQETTRRPDS